MKVTASVKPKMPCTAEPHPQKPGMALVRLFANVEPYEESVDKTTVSGWTYNEYQLVVPWYPNLEKDVAAAYDSWLTSAKAAEDEKDQLSLLIAAQSDTDSMVVDQEYRLTLLELLT